MTTTPQPAAGPQHAGGAPGATTPQRRGRAATETAQRESAGSTDQQQQQVQRQGQGQGQQPARSQAAGDLEVKSRAVGRIAEYASREVEGAQGPVRRVMGQSLGGPADEAGVSVDVDGGVAAISMKLSVEWPHEVRGVTEEVRRVVRERVEELTGQQVDHVDIRVSALVPPAGSGGGRVA